MKNLTTTAVGARIRYFRLAKGLTQEELAHRSELHNTYIGQIERGEKNLSILSLSRILQALNLPYSVFFEPFDIQSEDSSAAAQCYEIIKNQSVHNQDHFLVIMKEIELLAEK